MKSCKNSKGLIPHSYTLRLFRKGSKCLFGLICLFLLTSTIAVFGQNSATNRPQLLLKNGNQNVIQVNRNISQQLAKVKARSDFRDHASAAQFDGESYLILQFDKILTGDALAQLREKGVHLHDYIPQHAYLARMPQDTALEFFVDLGLVGYYRPAPENKMSPHFYSQIDDGDKNASMKIVATFTGNISEEKLRSALAAFSNARQIEFNARFHYFIAEMVAQEIRELAGLPFITSVGRHSEEVSFDAPRDHDPDSETSHGDTHNELIRANVIKSTLPGFHGLTGEGVVVGVGDNVYQGPTHVDMQGRHQILDPGQSNNGTFSDHGNHTSGTAGGNGTRRPRFTGLAPKATIYTARTSEIFTLGLEAADPMVISSNSWSTNDPNFKGILESKGRYNIHSQTIDQLLREEKQLLSVHSAGNFGDQQLGGYPRNYLSINPSYGSAKNTLVVGRFGFATGFFITPSYGPTCPGCSIPPPRMSISPRPKA